MIEEVGKVSALDVGDAGTLTVSCQVVNSDAAIGDSIAVNGVCLTLIELASEGGFTCGHDGRDPRTDLARRHRRGIAREPRTGDAGRWATGWPHGPGARGRCVGDHPTSQSSPSGPPVTYELPEDLSKYVVEKGSITIDGTSLTVTEVTDSTFSVGLIPHTMASTTHGRRAVGDRVNLEVDIIAKYVERQLAGYLAQETDR